MNKSGWGCCYSTEPAGGGKQCEIGDTAHEHVSWNGKPERPQQPWCHIYIFYGTKYFCNRNLEYYVTGWMTVKQDAQRICSGESKRHVTSQTNKNGKYTLVTSAELFESLPNAGAGVGKIYNPPHNNGKHYETYFKPCFQNPQFSLLFHLNIISLQAPKHHNMSGKGHVKKKKKVT